MAQVGTYSDHITLQADLNLYKIELQIVSFVGNDARTLIQAQEFQQIATLYLGHLAEGGDENYVKVDQHFSDVVDFVITTDDASNTDTVDLDVSTDAVDNDEAVGLDVAADDAAGPDAAADGTINDN